MPEDFEPTEAEKRVIAAAKTGEMAIFGRAAKISKIDASGRENWGPERTIRAEFLYRLCVDPPQDWPVHAKGVRIGGARIAGILDFQSATLHHPLVLIACLLGEPIELMDAETRTLIFSRCRLAGINADRAVIKGRMALDNVVVEGEVRLLGAEIGGQLSCTGATFENAGGLAFNADGVVTKGGIFLHKVIATGEVRLLGAEIGGELSCVGATFENADGRAFNAEGVIAKGNMLLDNVTATGGVWLLGAEIGGQLSCIGAQFENAKDDALSLQGARVGGEFIWQPRTHPKGVVDLNGMHVAVMHDSKTGWPESGSLWLDGFTYGRLSPSNLANARDRLDWLRRQPFGNGAFHPQAYEKLIKVFREMGHERDAREIAIAKQEDLRKSGALGTWTAGWLWNRFLSATISHGYRPWRAALWMLLVISVGTIVFELTFSRYDALMPARERVYLDKRFAENAGWRPDGYPLFQSFIYSADVFLPIVDLRQQEYWRPDHRKGFGMFAWIYTWFHIALGWVLTTVLVAGLTGIVRKD